MLDEKRDCNPANQTSDGADRAIADRRRPVVLDNGIRHPQKRGDQGAAHAIEEQIGQKILPLIAAGNFPPLLLLLLLIKLGIDKDVEVWIVAPFAAKLAERP